MIRTFALVFSFYFLFLVGCSSEQSTGDVTAQRSTLPTAADSIGPPAAIPETLFAETPDNEPAASDSLIAALLEKARQHYVSATTAQGNGDRHPG
jgi:hypothetical protein